MSESADSFSESIVFSHADIEAFSAFSHDVNPLHTQPSYARKTAYGEPVVFGVLGVLACLKAIAPKADGSLRDIRIEWQNAIFPDVDYSVHVESLSNDVFEAELIDGARTLVHVEAEYAAPGEVGPPPVDEQTDVETPTDVRTTAQTYDKGELEAGHVCDGTYATDLSATESASSFLVEAVEQIGWARADLLGFLSYLAGMEVPGRRALLYRADITFERITEESTDQKNAFVDYRAKVDHYDAGFGMLSISVDACHGQGIRSHGTLMANVREELGLPRADAVTDTLPEGNALEGKTALVTGASRGFGAAIALALAARGANVALNFHKSRDDAEAIRDAIAGLSGDALLVQGDASDPDWADDARASIIDSFGGLHLLVCNAATPPQPTRLTPETRSRIDDYVAQNFALLSTSLAEFLSEIEDNGGTVAFVSSIFADTAPEAFPQYTAAKTAGEGLIRSTAAAYSGVEFAIARPPRMQTGMSNTSVNAQNALAPETAAAHFVAQLGSLPESGPPVHFIEDFDDSDAVPNSASSDSSDDVVLNEASDATVPVEGEIEKEEPADFGCGPGEGESDMVYVAATFTTRPVVPGLQFWRDEMDQDYAIRLAPYNQVFQQLLTPNTPMMANEDGLNVLMIRWADWLREIEEGDDLDVAHEHVQDMMADLKKALNAWTDRAPSRTLLLRCPSGEPHTGDGWDDLFGTLDNSLANATRDLGTVDVVHTEAFHEIYGVDDVFDPVRDRIGHIPFRPSYYHFLATLVARRYHALKRDPFKVIVSDCDNTLWGGVVGEEGPLGVDVDGRYRAYQEMLLEQKEKGMVICLASKNVEQNVMEVFEQRSDMALGLEDVVDHRINWDSKSENIASIADSLNLGLESFIFLDDNPVEVGEVRSRLPQVLAIEWPESDEGVQQWLDHLWALDHYSVTGEDAKRTQRYQAQVAREELESETLSFGNFISSLDLEIDARPLVEEDVPRTAQLTQRTNQFNFSQIRRTRSDVRAMIDASTHEVWTFRASDRFGDYGLVGVLIVELQGDVPTLDTFLLSCRVLGRGVEHRMIQKLGAVVQAHDAEEAIVRFNPTVKNEPAQRFLNTFAPIDVFDQEDTFEVEVAASELLDLTFEPDEWEDPREQEGEDTIEGESDSPDVTSFRDRNALLRRVVTDLSPLPNLIDAMVDAGYAEEDNVQTSGVSNESASSPDPTGPTRAEVEQTVIDIVSDQLSIPAGDIQASASMEDYIRDSFQIVGITVELKKHYPSIPETILFEHTTLDDVVDAIAGDVVADGPDSDDSGSKTSIPNGSPSEGPDKQPARVPTQPINYAASSEPIAVIGMNGRYPSADTIDAFWKMLRDGRSAVGPVPSDRWTRSRLPEGEDGERLGDARGGFVSEPFRFDAPFFQISPREARLMDPQQRLFLEVVWGLLEDAGYTPERLGRRTGVFAGVIANDYEQLANDIALDGNAAYRWSDDYQIPNRISYAFDFQGPSLALDTACSSSGTALHLACRSLQRGECNAAVVGGVNLFLHPSRFVQYDQMQIISPDGTCRPFGEGANGTVYGEGVGALLLKPLAAAEQDGDNIHGVLRGTAVNSGGRTNGFTVPNPHAQSALIQEALDDAGVSPETIDYIEAHGTGTSLGDPIEVRGLTDAFSSMGDESEASCALGSVKSNIGHLESAAAIAGVTKVLLQMKHGTLAPSLHAEATNDGIDFDTTPFHIQQEASSWARDDDIPRRAGVSSFGAGGSNAHVIIEEYIPSRSQKTSSGVRDRPALVVLSAQDEDVLHERACQLYNVVTGDAPPSLESIAYTLQVGRESFEHRVAIPARSLDDLAAQLDRYLDGNPSARTRTGTVPPDRMDDLTLGDSDAGASYLEALAEAGEVDKIAGLWTLGTKLDWDALYSDLSPRRVSLPVYPFQGEEHRLDPSDRNPDSVPASPIGTRIASRHVDGVLYQAPVGLNSMPTLADHAIYDTHVVPGALYISHALTVAEAEETYPHRLENVTFPNLLRLSENDVAMECHWKPEESGDGIGVELASYSPDSDAWTTHCAATYRSGTLPDASGFDLAAMRERCSTQVDRGTFYREHRAVGFEWGAAYQGVQRLWTGDDEALAWVERPDAAAGRAGEYVLHPAMLDACFQVFAAAGNVTMSGQHGTDAFLPIGVDSVTVYQSPPSGLWSYARVTHRTEASLTVDVVLLAEDGTFCAVFNGLNVLRADRTRVVGDTSSSVSPSTPAGGDDVLYAPTWIPDNRTSGDVSETGRWVFVSESSSSLDPIRKRANELGLTVETVVAGDDSIQRNGQPFPGGDALDQVLDDGTVDRVVYVSSPLNACGAQLNLTTIKERLRTGTTLVQRLVRRIANGEVGNAKIWTVTHGAYSIDDSEDAGAPSLLSPLWGLGRALRWEQPDAWGGAVDLPTNPMSEHIDALLNEIAVAPDGTSGEDHVAFRDRRYVFRLDSDPAIDSEATSDEFAVHNDGVYLITGAFGSLGMRVAEWLVEEGAKTLALVSRSGPSDEQRSQLDSWCAQGIKVHVQSVDVTDGEAVGDLLDGLDDLSIRGVFHCAGVLDDGLLMNLDWERCWSVLAPKVAGAWNLHEQTVRRDMTPDAFVLFSSASALLGAPGQANYVSANLFLGALAAYRRASGRSALAIDWGPWADAGMASRVDGSAVPWTDGSAGAFDPDDALGVLRQLLHNSAGRVAALPYNWTDIVDTVEASDLPSVLRGIGSDDAVPSGDITESSPKPSSVDSAHELSSSAGDGAPSCTEPQTPSVDAIRSHIVELAASQLGYDDPSAIDTRRSFADLGFDSLMAVNLRNDLNAAYDLSLPASVLFDHPTATTLARHVHEKLDATQSEEHRSEQTSESFSDTTSGDETVTMEGGDDDTIASLSDAEVNAWIEEELDALEDDL